MSQVSYSVYAQYSINDCINIPVSFKADAIDSSAGDSSSSLIGTPKIIFTFGFSSVLKFDMFISGVRRYLNIRNETLEICPNIGSVPVLYAYAK